MYFFISQRRQQISHSLPIGVKCEVYFVTWTSDLHSTHIIVTCSIEYYVKLGIKLLLNRESTFPCKKLFDRFIKILHWSHLCIQWSAIITWFNIARYYIIQLNSTLNSNRFIVTSNIHHRKIWHEDNSKQQRGTLKWLIYLALTCGYIVYQLDGDNVNEKNITKMQVRGKWI